MSREPLRAALATLILAWSTTLVIAQQLGTAKEARAMLDRAIAALKSNQVMALSAFNDQDNKQFHDRDLYVFCFNMSDGKVTSYSAPFLIGADVRSLTLVEDRIGQRAYDTVRNVPEGKIAILKYKYPKPGTIEPATNCPLRHASATKVAALPITNSNWLNKTANLTCLDGHARSAQQCPLRG